MKRKPLLTGAQVVAAVAIYIAQSRFTSLPTAPPRRRSSRSTPYARLRDEARAAVRLQGAGAGDGDEPRWTPQLRNKRGRWATETDATYEEYRAS